MFTLNKYKIFQLKFRLFYPIYEYIYKNNNFIKHKFINYDKSKIIFNKYLFILPIYKDELQNLNIEHLWCKQWIKDLKINKNNSKEQSNKSLMTHDLHHLFSSNSLINSIRKSYVFSDLNKNNLNTIYIHQNGKITDEFNFYCKIDKNRQIFEPPEHSKDIIVRSLTYLLFRYPDLTNQEFSNKISSKVYLNWYYKNKIEFEELMKNELINCIQKNKNPFITYPILIPILFDDSDNFLKNIIKIIPNQIYCLYTSFFIKLNLKYVIKNKKTMKND